MYEENISAASGQTQQPGPGVQESLRAYQQTVDEFLAVADVKKVYGEPVERNGQTIIPTAEVLAGIGFGVGSGGGTGKTPAESGFGSGAGGGGRTFSRPVAIIVSGPQGVEVQPVFDITKIALTALTAFGFMIATVGRMQRGPREE